VVGALLVEEVGDRGVERGGVEAAVEVAVPGNPRNADGDGVGEAGAGKSRRGPHLELRLGEGDLQGARRGLFEGGRPGMGQRRYGGKTGSVHKGAGGQSRVSASA